MKKPNLPHGTLTILAKEFDISPSTIKNMLDGKYLHDRQKEVFKRAKQIKDNHLQKLKDLENLKKELA